MKTNSTIKITPPLPCGTQAGESLCGKPASVAYADPAGGGHYIILPICRDCALATMKLYFPDEVSEK
jgi:hypothetical protein